jgi:hypothetical protein
MAFAVRGKALWLPPLLLFASVVLLGSLAFAIANLDRGEETLPEVPSIGGGEGRPGSFGGGGEGFQLIWRVLIATLLIIAIGAAIYARWTKQKVVSVWELIGYAFGIGVVGGLVIFWPVILEALESLTVFGGQPEPPSPGGSGDVGPIPRSAAFPIAVVVFAVVVIAIYVFALSSRIFPHLLELLTEREPDRTRRRLEAASAVRRTLLDLEAGTDFRTTVMACYQRVCSLLATRGVTQQEALTAREIEGLALAELGLSRGSVDDLTGLFEEARYSTHEIGPSQRDRAVECLSQIRRELEG